MQTQLGTTIPSFSDPHRLRKTCNKSTNMTSIRTQGPQPTSWTATEKRTPTSRCRTNSTTEKPKPRTKSKKTFTRNEELAAREEDDLAENVEVPTNPLLRANDDPEQLERVRGSEPRVQRPRLPRPWHAGAIAVSVNITTTMPSSHQPKRGIEKADGGTRLMQDGLGLSQNGLSQMATVYGRYDHY